MSENASPDRVRHSKVAQNDHKFGGPSPIFETQKLRKIHSNPAFLQDALGFWSIILSILDQCRNEVDQSVTPRGFPGKLKQGDA